MNINPIRNEKTLQPNEVIIKTLLENLLILSVNLGKVKAAKPQRRLVDSIIMLLRNRKKNFTYQDLFGLLLSFMRNAKQKETIAITARLFSLVQNAYKDALKEKP